MSKTEIYTLFNFLFVQQPTTGESGDEPLYVNAKQYHRILKRRQARAKLESEGRIPKERQVLNLSFQIYTKQLTQFFLDKFHLNTIPDAPKRSCLSTKIFSMSIELCWTDVPKIYSSASKSIQDPREFFRKYCEDCDVCPSADMVEILGKSIYMKKLVTLEALDIADIKPKCK